MMRSLYTGATGMIAQQLNIDVISNNLANVNTTGFKKSRAEFEDLMYQTMKIAGATTEGDNRLPVGIQVGLGTRPTAVHKFYTQGDFQNTGNVDIPAPLFILTGEKGSIYTLDGHGSETEEAHIMGVNEKGVLSTLLPGESNRISLDIEIPNTNISSANYKLKTITEGCDGIDELFYLQWLNIWRLLIITPQVS